MEYRHTHNAATHTLTWSDGVILKFSRLRSQSERFTAELTVVSDLTGHKGIVLHERFDLLSGYAKKQVGDRLHDWSDNFNWGKIIETSVAEVLGIERSGAEAKRLKDVSLSERLNYRLYPLLLEKMPTVFFGDGGSLKSFVSVWMAARIAAGLNAEPGAILVCDWESDEEDWRERLSMVCTGLGIDLPENIIYRRMAASFQDDLEYIRTLVAEHQIEVIIHDSAAYACGGKPEEADTTNRYFLAMRSMEVTHAIIAHITKTSGKDHPFGSIFWHNGARATFYVHSKDANPGLPVELGLVQKKNNRGRKAPPMGFDVAFKVADASKYSEGDSVTFKQTEYSQLADSSDHMTDSDRFLSAIKDKAKTKEEIMEIADITDESYRKAKSRLLKKELIIEIEPGVIGRQQA